MPCPDNAYPMMFNMLMLKTALGQDMQPFFSKKNKNVRSITTGTDNTFVLKLQPIPACPTPVCQV